jgi:hypothetical protein
VRGAETVRRRAIEMGVATSVWKWVRDTVEEELALAAPLPKGLLNGLEGSGVLCVPALALDVPVAALPHADESFSKALGVKRGLSLLLNLSATASGALAVTRAACELAPVGGVHVLPLLSTATLASSTQLGAIRLMSNMAAAIQLREVPLGDEEDGLSLDRVVPLFAPFVQAFAETKTLIGGTCTDALLRLGGIVENLCLSKQGRPRGEALRDLGNRIASHGALRMLSLVLVDATDRKSRLSTLPEGEVPTEHQADELKVAIDTVRINIQLLSAWVSEHPAARVQVEAVLASLHSTALKHSTAKHHE